MTDTRDRILGCACDLYLRDGFEGFSMRKLARSVGVTAPALYRHFESKEHLLLDVVGEAYKVMIQYLHGALRGQDPAERFRLAGDGYLTFALEHQRYYEILYSYTEFLGLESLPEEIESLVCGIHQFWLDRVRECMDAGILKPGDPEVIARTFWALSHGLISIHQRKMLGFTEAQFREAFNEAARHLLAGVGTGGGRDRKSGQPSGRGPEPEGARSDAEVAAREVAAGSEAVASQGPDQG